MLVDLYAIPTWLMVPLISVVFVSLTLVSLRFIHRRWNTELRREHNDIAGFVIAVVGVIYAVLVASVAIMASETYTKAEDTVSLEAALAIEIYSDAPGLGPTTSKIVRQYLKSYAHRVMTKEWKEMEQDDPVGDEGRIIDHIETVLTRYQPKTATQQVFLTEILHRLNKLLEARHHRILLATYGIAPVIWFVVIAGGIITIGFTFFFGLSNIRAHVLMSCGLALSIALVIAIILATDHPFLGDYNVSPKPFKIALQHMRQT